MAAARRLSGYLVLVVLVLLVTAEAVWAGQASLVSDAEKRWLLQVWGKVSTQYKRFTRTPVPRLAVAKKGNEVNFYYQQQGHSVFITWGAIKVFQGQDGEVAFFLAHELGHALAKHESQNSKNLLAFLRSLYTSADGAPLTLSRREKESLPDMWGLCLMSAAGYNPTDAAAGFGRMGMVGGTSYEFAASGKMVARWLDAHPKDEQRISFLHRSLKGGLVNRCRNLR